MRVLFFSVCLLLAPSLAWGWGFDGHRKLASMMHEPLPANACLRGWVAARQTTALQDDACDPDRWRYTSAGAKYDPDEWPRHYLEVDWVVPPESYPRDWGNAQILLRNYAVKNGQVPWHVETRYRQLVNAFKSKDPAAILQELFLLSHYVTDAFSVLHNTKNFDPDGLHQRWESDMFDNNTQLNGIAADAKTYYGTVGWADPKNNIFDVVLVGNGLVGTLVAADQSHVGDMPGFYGAVRELTARRWGDALTLMASILWTAWAEAGAQVLPGFASNCSMAVPSQEIVLKGYPPAGGFGHPDGGPHLLDDAGSPMTPDASVGDDAGSGVPVTPFDEEAPACGCHVVPGSAGLFLLLVLGGMRWARRQRV